MEKVCCVCHRVKRDNSWVKGGKELVLAKLSHGYCPTCYRKVMQSIMDIGINFQPAID